MNKTHFVLAAAAVLALAALVQGRASGPEAPAQRPVLPSVVKHVPYVAAASSAGPLTLTAALSSGRVLEGSSQIYAKVDVAAQASLERVSAERVPLNLAIAIDHSGSMAGQKMEQAKQGALSLISALRAGDRLAIISFASGVEVFPSTVVDSDSLPRMRAFVSSMSDTGGTNISGALRAAMREAGQHTRQFEVSRVVLLSDGVPTEGDVSPGAILATIDSGRQQGITTSAFGVGLDFNASLMRDIGTRGAGTYAFVENAQRLSEAFATELKDASSTLARQVAVELQPRPGVSVEDVPGYAFTRVGNGVRVQLYDFAPMQTAQFLVRLKVEGVGSGNVPVAAVTLSALDVEKKAPFSTAVSLEAKAAADQATVDAESHGDVVELAKRYEINVQVAKAADAYERGDTKTAFDIMGNTRRLFGMSADALAGSEAELEGRWRKGGSEASIANKGLTKKTMKNFGMNNTAQY